LEYLRARYLAANLGRFYSLDPQTGLVHNPTSLHRYLYAANNPVSKIDPTGKQTSLVEISVELSISATLEDLQFAFAKAGLKAISRTTLIADAVLTPAYHIQDLGWSLIDSGDADNGLNLFLLGNDLEGIAYQAIAATIFEVYQDTVNSVALNLKVKFNGLVNLFTAKVGVFESQFVLFGQKGPSTFDQELVAFLDDVASFVSQKGLDPQFLFFDQNAASDIAKKDIQWGIRTLSLIDLLAKLAG